MTCYHPLAGFRSRLGGWTSNRTQAYIDQPMSVPCGRCIGCRLEHSRQWATRMVHEAQMHEDNCFVTLTFDDIHLPEDRSLDVSHFQKFMKRLRKSLSGKKVRFYHSGEYGEELNRPHYHACLFGHDFHDKTFLKMRGDYPLFTSKSLEKLWPYGFSSLGSVEFGSARYTASYVTKKVMSSGGFSRVNWDSESKQWRKVRPEYATMSRRPGLGLDFWKQFSEEIKRDDAVLLDGVLQRPPRFYDNHLSDDRHGTNLSSERSRTLGKRRKQGRDNAWNSTPERLATREAVAESKLKTFSKRSL